MLGTIGPDVARAATGLRKSHPYTGAKEVLDAVMRFRTGSLQDFGDATKPGTEFALIVAEAFDTGMDPVDWRIVNNPDADKAIVAALVTVWYSQILPRFAAHYGLTP